MCLQCATDALHFGEIFPGWFLMKATKPHEDWKSWGLVESNDPTFVWEIDPEIDPEYGFTDEQVNNSPHDWNQWFGKAVEFEKCLQNCGPRSGYQLWKACLASGYDPERDGYRISLWIFHKMREFIQANPGKRECPTCGECFDEPSCTNDAKHKEIVEEAMKSIKPL